MSARPDSNEEAEGAGQTGAKGHILLIEDETVMALYERHILTDDGYSTEWARDGKTAVALFRKNEGIDMVISDIDLGPEIDGIETARLLRAIRPCPLVFLSSLSKEEVDQAAQDLRPYRFVSKAGADGALLPAIEASLGSAEAKRAS